MKLSYTMPNEAHNMSVAINTLDLNLSEEDVERLEEIYGWREDVLNRLKSFFDTSNIMGIENAFTYAILAMNGEDRNELFKAMVYSSSILATKLYADPRNEKTVELLKNLSKADFSLNLADQHVDSVKVIELVDYQKQQAEKISSTLDALFTEIKAMREKYEFNSANFGAVFATGLMQQHNTLQQVIVKCIVNAMRIKIAEEKLNPSEKDQDILAIYAQVNSLNDSLYFPYI